MPSTYTPCPTAAAQDVISANMLYPVMSTGRRARRYGLGWALGWFLSLSVVVGLLA